MVAGSRNSEDVTVVWSCLVVSVDRLSGFVLFGAIPSVVAHFLHDRAVPDSPRRCVNGTRGTRSFLVLFHIKKILIIL